MMKISKPVLTNEFVLSPVQFTSLNTILFKNIKSIYEGNENILLEYEHSSKVESSSRDWIGIFPRGWNTLQQYVTFEWVSQSVPSGSSDQNKENGDVVRRSLNFAPKYHISSVTGNSFYQFVYISKQIEVLGVSSYFRFDTSTGNDSAVELECLVPVTGPLRSTSVSDFGVLMPNNMSSATSIDTRTLHTNSIHSLQNLDAEGKSWTKGQIPLGIADMKKPLIFPKKTTGTGDALDPYSSHSEPLFPMSFPASQCKKCFHFKRGGEFIRSQQVLQSKLKIVMERNKVLEERTQEMKKEMERLQAESKKLKMSFYNINKEKIAYEKFVKDFIKSLEKDSIVRVVNGSTEILVKKVNYVGMEEHPRDKKTSKRERELKAVIGLQEITIRNLINSLQEKAKSVQELNQTVKLAQAFTAVRSDSREFESDAEDEVSNSDETSEYEFSLTKPEPPEEVAVEDTDAVLDDIRRATEMELKDIGISRSLGRSSSQESESALGIANLSVRSFQNQNEGTLPKKPRLFDNVEDCWPCPADTPKTIHRKVLESCSNVKNGNHEEVKEKQDSEKTSQLKQSKELSDANTDYVELDMINEEVTGTQEVEGDHAVFENFYDACEVPVTEVDSEGGESKPSDSREVSTAEEKVETDKKEKSNFLVTAIIPQNLDAKPPKSPDEWTRSEKEESVEKKAEVAQDKGKKFTCQLSINFAAKVVQKKEDSETMSHLAIEGGNSQESENKVCQTFDPKFSEGQFTQDKPVVTLTKSNKSIEIKITQVEQKEKSNKNCLQQKMVVKFGKEQQAIPNPEKPSKIEFNLAVTSHGDATKSVKTNSDDPPCKTGAAESEVSETKDVDDGQELDLSPRTVWNDATDDFVFDDATTPEEALGEQPVAETFGETETKATKEEGKDKSGESSDESNAYQDSLRYERNLEFFQQKTAERGKEGEAEEEREEGEEEEGKEKPTAILIQNGQTKLALIRYQ